MKVIKTEEFSNTMNLPRKTISVDGNLIKNQEYFLDKIRDDNKYRKAYQKNIEKAKRYKFANFPVNVSDMLEPTVVFNQILKDIYIRYEFLNGNIVNDNITFVDRGVENSESNLNVDNVEENIKVKEIARSRVISNLKKQIHEVNMLGTLLNYNEHYNCTTDGNLELIIINKFLELYRKRKIYRSFRPIYWCTECRTSIGKDDVKSKKEMVDEHYILYNVKKDDEDILKLPKLTNVYIIATTILPWSMISSEYIAIIKDGEYSIVQALENETKKYYIIEGSKVENVMKSHPDAKYVVIRNIKAAEVAKLQCVNPLNYRKNVSIICTSRKNIVLDDQNGTGIRIVSSGHSYLDYIIHKQSNQNGIKCVLNEDGTTNSLAFVYNNNLNYLDVNEKVIEFLQNNDFVYNTEKVKTAICYCKECGNKLIYRSITEWYLKKNEKITNELFEKLVSKMSSSDKYKTEEFKSQVEKINSFNEIVISDRKKVGIPIPVFVCAECNSEIVGDSINDIVIKTFKEKGSDFWYKSTPEQILKGQVECKKCGGKFLFKDNGSLNDFFKELSIPFILNSNEDTKSICIESKERFFNKLNEMSYADEVDKTFGSLDKLMVHDVVEEKMENNSKTESEDEKTKKKSIFDLIRKTERKTEKLDVDNDIAIKNVIQKYGIDVLRLWVMSKSNDNDIRLNKQYMINTKKKYMNIRRTLKFLLSNLTDFNPTKNYINPEDRNDIDRILYVKLQQLNTLVEEQYKVLNFKKIYDALIKYSEKTLCDEYFETIKYRLYVLKKDEFARRSSQSTMYDILMSFVTLLQPIIPLTLEEIWPYIWHSNEEEASNILVFRREFKNKDIDINNELKKWNRIYKLKNEIKKYISKAKIDEVIKHKIEATVTINTSNEEYKQFILNNYEDIRGTLGVSQILVNICDEEKIEISKTEGTQCRRCRQYSIYIGQNFKYTYLCPKCADILGEEE